MLGGGAVAGRVGCENETRRAWRGRAAGCLVVVVVVVIVEMRGLAGPVGVPSTDGWATRLVKGLSSPGAPGAVRDVINEKSNSASVEIRQSRAGHMRRCRGE